MTITIGVSSTYISDSDYTVYSWLDLDGLTFKHPIEDAENIHHATNRAFKQLRTHTGVSKDQFSLAETETVRVWRFVLKSE